MANKIPLAVADFQTQLSTALAVGGTSFSISSATDDDGNALPAGKYCFTVDNGKSTKEYLLGQLNGTAVTSVVRVSRQGVETSGSQYKHRIGATAIVTDFATIQRVADVLRGQVDLDGSSPMAYDAEPTLADRKELATVGYVLDTVTGGTVAFDTQTVTGTAGATVAAGELLYFNTADQEWYLTDADTAATVEGVLLGIALGAGTDGVAITNGVLVQGIYTTTGLTAGSEYYASNTAGAYSTGAGTTSRKIGIALSTTKLFLYSSNPITVTSNEKDALLAGGDFGTPGSSNKFVTQGYIASQTLTPVIRVYEHTLYGSNNSQFDITSVGGNTYRYTWDGGGTDPGINSTTFPVGAVVCWISPTSGGNNGTFTITASGTNYFEVTNASGGAQTNQQFYFNHYTSVCDETTWTKPSNLSFVIVEAVGGGGGGGGSGGSSPYNVGGGGGGGGYSKKVLHTSELGATESVFVGGGGAGGNTSSSGSSGSTSSFGSHISATGGEGGLYGGNGGLGGVGSGGDINTQGTPGGLTSDGSEGGAPGGSSFYGGGAKASNTYGNRGGPYGGGGSGADRDGADQKGGPGYPGIVIVTEYYS